MSEHAQERLKAALSGRYEIQRKLGEGGMATVYLARDVKHNRNVALKVLKPELAAVVGAERFLAEIETTANLQHPHILPLFDSGEADSFLFYVMPYVEGETLQDRIERERQLPVDEALGIATSVASALQHAHDRGVIHRDIKPGNIMLQDGQPVVGDFGIALAVGMAGGARLTETGLSVGTPYYMSPEQATGDQSVGPASDTYALACVLYEMLVGEPPYPGNTAQAVLGKIIQGLPVSATAIRRAVPANVDAAIRKALEKLPADRFASVQGFAKALADLSFRYGDALAGPAPGARGRRARELVLATTTLGFALLSFWALSRPAPAVMTHRASVLLPEPRGGALGTMALSADGSLLVYEGPTEGGGFQLWVRRWDQLNATALAGTLAAVDPAVSPDGQEVAFVIAEAIPRRLMITSLTGGVPRTLTESATRSPHWGEDGFIYYTDPETRGISRVPAQGGARAVITESPQDTGEGVHLGAHYFAEGDAVLFNVFMPGGPVIRVADVSTGRVTDLGQIGVR
ncbi:MAG TPA: LpqB family beta-propeller domain-containing protein, partial [Longimicrobiales bacterium]|nr:LpqB family beta-propeller domain-containing protein [Longimicrobiales bacterium]